ncbi:MAG: glycosyltransferase family 39 protein, partial [Anaerolineae bacterium]
MSGRDRLSRWWAVGLLLAVTGLGFWLRWLYARDVSFFVDEYLTVRAAERILAHGVPLLPSGNFYSHGLLLSYLEAPLLALGIHGRALLRLPVVLLSTATIPLTYWLGRRAFSRGAGLLAAALLAVAPEAILWGGRVRMYGPLQFFVLAATVIFYLWVVEERDRPLYAVLFVLAYWASIFCHAEAMLLLPLWGLWALVQRGWRWCLRPLHLAAFGLSGLAIVVEILLRRIGPPVQARVAAGVFEPQARQYLGAGIDWPGVLKVIRPLFLDPLRLPLTLLVLVGLILLLWAVLKVRSNRFSGESTAAVEGTAKAVTTNRKLYSYLYLYFLLLPVLFLLLFAVDPEWKSPRYGLMLLPYFFLLAGTVLAWVGRWLGRRMGLDRPLWRMGATT